VETMHHAKLSDYSVHVLAVLMLHQVSLLRSVYSYLTHHLEFVVLHLLGLWLLNLSR